MPKWNNFCASQINHFTHCAYKYFEVDCMVWPCSWPSFPFLLKVKHEKVSMAAIIKQLSRKLVWLELGQPLNKVGGQNWILCEKQGMYILGFFFYYYYLPKFLITWLRFSIFLQASWKFFVLSHEAEKAFNYCCAIHLQFQNNENEWDQRLCQNPRIMDDSIGPFGFF